MVYALVEVVETVATLGSRLGNSRKLLAGLLSVALACVIFPNAGAAGNSLNATGGPSELGVATVRLTPESDGRQRAVGNIRMHNSSTHGYVKILRAEVRNAQNMDVGVFKVRRMLDTENRSLMTGHPLPPKPGDGGFEESNALWQASFDASGAMVKAGEYLNFTVGLTQPVQNECSLTEGIDIIYESEGKEHVALWGTFYVIEKDKTSDCLPDSDWEDSDWDEQD